MEAINKHPSEKKRLQNVPLLALVPFSAAEPILQSLLQSQQPLPIQQAALQTLAQHTDPRIAEIILQNWPSWSPPLRREAQEILFSRITHLTVLLTAAEQGKFALNQLEPARRDQLLHHSNTQLRERAKLLLAAQTTSRAQIIKKYQSSLTLHGDVSRGKQLFLKNCATCHQFDGQGHAVAPDLNSALGNKTKDALLIDILDPNREVDSRYVNYIITTKNGRTLTGVISTESASSLTLRRAEGVEETCLRSDIDEIQGTGKSLMPENLEEQLALQELADVMTYLLSVRSRK